MHCRSILYGCVSANALNNTTQEAFSVFPDKVKYTTPYPLFFSFLSFFFFSLLEKLFKIAFEVGTAKNFDPILREVVNPMSNPKNDLKFTYNTFVSQVEHKL